MTTSWTRATTDSEISNLCTNPWSYRKLVRDMRSVNVGNERSLIMINTLLPPTSSIYQRRRTTLKLISLLAKAQWIMNTRKSSYSRRTTTPKTASRNWTTETLLGSEIRVQLKSLPMSLSQLSSKRTMPIRVRTLGWWSLLKRSHLQSRNSWKGAPAPRSSCLPLRTDLGSSEDTPLATKALVGIFDPTSRRLKTPKNTESIIQGFIISNSHQELL